MNDVEMLNAMIFLFSCLLFFASSYALAASNCDQKRSELTGIFSKITDEFRSNLQEEKIPGIAFAIFDKDCELYAGAVGVADLESQAPMDANTRIIRVASVSKLFTTVAAARLIEKGKLRWETPIMDLTDVGFVKHILITEKDSARLARWRKIRVGDLMSHQAGISKDLPGVEIFLNAAAISDQAYPTRRDLYLGIDRTEFLYEVGEASPGIKYSNLAGNLLGEIVSQYGARSEKLADFVLSGFMSPLRLTHTFYDIPQRFQSLMSSTYGAMESDGSRIKMPPVFKVGSYGGSIGIATTAKELGRFGREFLKMSRFEKNQLLHDHAVIREFFFPRNALERSEAYGHGPAWTHLPDEKMDQPLWVGHVGTGYGERAIMMVSPERDLGFAILFNTKKAFREKYGKIISRALAEFKKPGLISTQTKELLAAARSVLSGPPIVYDNPKGEEVSEEDLQRFVGVYRADNFGEIEVQIVDGSLSVLGLRLIAENHKLGKFRFVRSTDFLFNAEAAVFRIDDDGKTNSVRLADSSVFRRVKK